jgi:hypothetical protein
LNIMCKYCGKRLVQPTVKHHNKECYLKCYLKKDGSKISMKAVLDDISRKLESIEIHANALDNKSSLEERRKKFY